MFFDGAANFKRVGIGTVLISESGQHYPASAKIRFPCTNNMAEYEELCKKFIRIEFRHVPRIKNEFADALTALSSMIQHPDKNYIDPIKVEIRDHHAYCFHVNEEPDGYHTTISTSTGSTPYMLVYGTEAVIPAEVEIPSLKVIQEAKLDNAEWIRVRKEQLVFIDNKRMDAVCHGQLYQNRMASAFNKRVKPRQFTRGQLVLKKIFPYQEEAKGKFAPN
nr:uncharacterized protein LOC104111796 [Nicotiana tomentosiformis]